MKQRGATTLIELIIGFAFIMIIGLIALPVIMGVPISNNNVSWGVNGMTESRCIENYKFIVGQDGNARQILDEFGKGVRCETASKPGNF